MDRAQSASQSFVEVFIVIELPLKTVAGLNARESWQKRAARVRNERAVAKLFTASYLRKHFGDIRASWIVTMTRLSPGTLDSDNLVGSQKHVRDGIADALGLPDNDPRIEWRYAQERCKRGSYGVRIEIT
jgi:hypothetical protein